MHQEDMIGGRTPRTRMPLAASTILNQHKIWYWKELGSIL